MRETGRKRESLGLYWRQTVAQIQRRCLRPSQGGLMASLHHVGGNPPPTPKPTHTCPAMHANTVACLWTHACTHTYGCCRVCYRLRGVADSEPGLSGGGEAVCRKYPTCGAHAAARWVSTASTASIHSSVRGLCVCVRAVHMWRGCRCDAAGRDIAHCR